MLKIDKHKLKIIFFVTTLIIQFILFFCYIYPDVCITTVHGINFWDCLFNGNIREFYNYNLNAELVAGTYHGVFPAYYDFMIYIIFAIWDFPLWLIKKVFHIDYILNTLFGIIWSKLIVLLFLFLTLIVFYKIINFLQENRETNRKVTYLFLTSIFLTAYICLLGQYDIIPIFFILLAIYFGVRNNTVLFVLFFSIAIPIKTFAFFPFIVLLLYKEKNVLKDLLYIICSLCPMLFFRWLIPSEGGNNIDFFYNFLFQNRIDLMHGGLPVFVIVFVLLCLYSYLKKPSDNQQQFCKEMIFLSFLSFISFLATCYTFPYWFMYMVPFLYLIIAYSPQNYGINMLLETFMGFFVVIGQIFTFYWCFSSDIVSNMLLSRILPSRTSEYLSAPLILEHILGESVYSTISSLILPVCSAVFIALVIFFIYINNPWKDPETKLYTDSHLSKIFYCVRLILSYIICSIPLIAYLL